MARDSSETGDGFTAAERAAMKERARENRSTAKGAAKAEADARALHEKIAEMPDDERMIAEKIHEIFSTAAPQLAPKTWYGMPAWARDGKIVGFFQPASKFDARYSTLGFNDPAQLDDGPLWATSFAVTEITPDVASRIEDLVRRAAG